jgi:anti-sigma regulatory factor (Ser/Thr protein kinase)
MSDRIRLTVPRERSFYPVAHLVLGGLALRQNLTIEALEDLHVAVDELLGRERGPGEVTLELRLLDGTLQARVGPFDDSALRHDLEPAGEGELGLRRVLDTTVDRVDVESGEGGSWVLLSKTVKRV